MDVHNHRCPICRTVWTHDRDTIPDAKYDEAHTCPVPNCGGRDTWKRDSGTPLFCHNGARTIDLSDPSAVGRAIPLDPPRSASLPMENSMSFEKFLREIGGDSTPSAPKISHAAQIARLREFKDRHDLGCPFQVGDFVTPREDAPLKGVGQPHIVLAVRPDAVAAFDVGDPSSNSYGSIRNIRVGSLHHGHMATHWCEAADFEPYTDHHAAADPERAYEPASA